MHEHPNTINQAKHQAYRSNESIKQKKAKITGCTAAQKYDTIFAIQLQIDVTNSNQAHYHNVTNTIHIPV